MRVDSYCRRCPSSFRTQIQTGSLDCCPGRVMSLNKDSKGQVAPTLTAVTLRSVCREREKPGVLKEIKLEVKRK